MSGPEPVLDLEAARRELEPWSRAMFLLQEVEAVGNAAEGLGITDAFHVALDGQPFWSPERLDELNLMAQWGPALPSWSWGRWVCNQAARVLHDGLRDSMRRAGLRAGWHAREDQAWAWRQLLLYDEGVLRFFVRRIAGSALLARAGEVESWLDAPMGGYELVASTPRSLWWVDLATEKELVTPNIGSAVLLLPGDRVIGRVVAADGGRVFEGRPLGVPPAVARAVAQTPEAWSALLRTARPGSSLGLVRDPRPIESLVTDVMPSVWPLGVPMLEQPVSARTVLDALADLLVEPVEPGPEQADPWACLSAALLTPYVWGELPEVVEARDVVVLTEAATVLAEPAAALCRRAVEELSEAA